jgi:hypothetical protein
MAQRLRRLAGIGLLLAPFVALLWVASYDRAQPTLAGIPLFYWYQLAWVGLVAVLIWVAGRLLGDGA